jgi:hypothetical protein
MVGGLGRRMKRGPRRHPGRWLAGEPVTRVRLHGGTQWTTCCWPAYQLVVTACVGGVWWLRNGENHEFFAIFCGWT